MRQHILYISTTLPTPGFGSSIIFNRHLKRLQGWKISILVTDDKARNHLELPEEWNIIKVPECKWWPPVKTSIPWSFSARLFLTEFFLRAKFKQKPDAILNHFGKNSCLAYYLSKKWNVPLNLVVHDRWEVWAKGHEAFFLGNGWDKKVLNQSSRIWMVSDEMGDYYRGQVDHPSKIKTLFPIPGGSHSAPPGWKEEYAASPVVGFSGSFHSHQIKIFSTVAKALLKKNGKLIVISKKIDETKKALSGFANIEYLEPFEKNTDAIEFFKKNVSVILVADSIDKKASGEGISFPSKFIEFSHCGLPVLLMSSPGTALSNLAKKLNWTAYVDNENVGPVIEKMAMKEHWQKMAGESMSVSRTIFSPENIQNQFLNELIVLESRDASR